MKRLHIVNGLAARLKSGPPRNLPESYFFRSLLGHWLGLAGKPVSVPHPKVAIPFIPYAAGALPLALKCVFVKQMP